MSPRARQARAILRKRRWRSQTANRYRRYGCSCGQHGMRDRDPRPGKPTWLPPREPTIVMESP